ncbi:glycerol uptake facilitator-like aquaporin [Vogesella indigofera]|uniref:Glycerol uptake facilitator-like aquaporin n=1 Tax=Vogesella indigofera TaxID=45465 RepID=A0A495BD00_VOGIN|nr:MIP/aquaporin family protein [Vogesella indigofera]RKQ58799.1 glycerol uptake facilitator-like aquaporin [Vogesella indigofera]
MRALVAEAIGSALLLAVVVGSGIMGQTLAAGNDAVALLANALATGAGLLVLITLFAPLSGAHFNPAVSLVMAARGELPWPRVLPYLAAQVAGAVAGVLLAHAMFGLPLLQESQHLRSGWPQWLAEVTATAGLLLTILGGVRHARDKVPLLVALYIVAAYWFTASTSFANPAVTLARSLSDTFAGIAPADVGGFVLAQLAGAAIGGGLGGWLFAAEQDTAGA